MTTLSLGNGSGLLYNDKVKKKKAYERQICENSSILYF